MKKLKTTKVGYFVQLITKDLYRENKKNLKIKTYNKF